jgi:hypothetical protein
MQFSIVGTVFEWRGPAPFYFVAVPEEQSAEIKASESMLTYGWGVIPVEGRIGSTEFTTSLIPRDGLYLVPIKNMVRLPEKLAVGDEIEISLTFKA